MAVYLLDPFEDDNSVLLPDELTGLDRWSGTRYLGFLWLQLQLFVEGVLEGTQLGAVGFVIDVVVTTLLG